MNCSLRFAFLAAALFVATACGTTPPPVPATPAPSPVERGKYIVSTAGCHDCHTPFKMGQHGHVPDPIIIEPKK